MITKRAIGAFLSRELESFDWLKKRSRPELEAMVADLKPVPKFISAKPMWDHQIVAFLIGVFMPTFLFLLGMGLGKSRVVLELLAYMKQRGMLKASLIVVPNDTAVENWILEIQEHRPDLTYVPLYGSSKERAVLLRRTADVFIIHYDGLVALCTSLMPTAGRKDKRKRQIDRAKIDFVASAFNVISLDESTEIMNRRSVTYRVCEYLSRVIEYRYCLTGTPFGRDPQALWAQFYFTDHGETLGPTLGLFREALFKKKDNFFSGGYDFVFDKTKTDVLSRMIRNRSIYYDEADVKDMPKKLYQPIWVPFTPDMEAYYKRVLEQFIAAGKGEWRTVQNSYLHMRQIASGFIGLVDDETGARATVEFTHNPKMEALRASVKEIPDGRKFLIFHEYVWTGKRIMRELEELKISFEYLSGQNKDNVGSYRRFRQKDHIRACVINNKSGAFALNFQVANYEYFVESPDSVIVRAQAEKRIHRGEQARRCFYKDIIMKGNSADMGIQVHLKEGGDLTAAVLKQAGKLRR